MNDIDPVVPQAEAVSLPSAGALLRQAREAAGMHIAAVAVALKVPVKKMEALEQDRFNELPDAVFVRALASSVCRILKIDPTEVLARLPQTGAPRVAHPGPGINAPFKPASGKTGPSFWSQLTRPAVLLGLLLVLAALVLILLPSIRQDLLPSLAALTPAQTNTGAAPSPDNLPTSAQTTVADNLAAPILAVEPMPPASEPAAAVATPTQPASPSAVSLTSTPTLAADPSAAAGDLLTFRAQSASWVQVTDAKGAVVLRKMLASGEVATATGALPMSAVVGRADATQVHVRGKPLDLIPLARDNVARFEVK